VDRVYSLDAPAPSGPDGFAEHAARAARARKLSGGGHRTGAARYVPRPDLSAALSSPAPVTAPAAPPRPEAPRWASTEALRERGPTYRPSPERPEQLEAAWAGRFSELEPVGQVLGTYLVCQGPGRMVIIDQHAAHERVTFQRLRAQARAGALEVQPLLIPLPLDLDEARSAALEDQVEALARIGFTVQAVPGEGWMVRAAPAVLGHARLERLVTDLVDELTELPEAMAVEERLDALMSCAACHGSVRAKDRLHNEEIRALLRQMDEIDFGAFCPHGRPVFVELDAATLAKMFHRS